MTEALKPYPTRLRKIPAAVMVPMTLVRFTLLYEEGQEHSGDDS